MQGERSVAPSASESSRGYHRAATAGECRRLYAFRYGLRLEPQRTADALALGSLLHLALMHRYLARGGFAALGSVEAMQRAPARIAHQFTRAQDIWDRYEVWADGADAALDVLDVEREYEARIGGRRVTTRLDLVGECRGELRVWDHKSTSGDLRGEVRAQSGSGQIALEEAIGEAVLPSMYDLPWGGVWINAISTTGADPVAVRGRARVEPGWRAAVVEAVGERLARAEEIEATAGWGTIEGAFALAPNPEACRGRWANSRCAFYEACREGAGALGRPDAGVDSVVDEVTRLREGAGR